MLQQMLHQKCTKNGKKGRTNLCSKFSPLFHYFQCNIHNIPYRTTLARQSLWLKLRRTTLRACCLNCVMLEPFFSTAFSVRAQGFRGRISVTPAPNPATRAEAPAMISVFYFATRKGKKGGSRKSFLGINKRYLVSRYMC